MAASQNHSFMRPALRGSRGSARCAEESRRRERRVVERGGVGERIARAGRRRVAERERGGVERERGGEVRELRDVAREGRRRVVQVRHDELRARAIAVDQAALGEDAERDEHGSARRTSLDGGSETRMIRQATTM